MKLAAQLPGLHVEVRDEQWLAEQGFGGVLAVGGGSARPPRFVELPGGRRPAPAPGPGRQGHHLRHRRHLDQAGRRHAPDAHRHGGGAAVIAAMLAIARLGLPVRVTGLVPAAENHVSGRPTGRATWSALRRHDHRGGQHRRRGADGAGRRARLRGPPPGARPDRRRRDPDRGDEGRAGPANGGPVRPRRRVADAVIAAGERAGERLVADAAARATWRRRSRQRDRRRAAGPARPPRHQRALFLREFTGGIPWAHLDIAGPARCGQAPTTRWSRRHGLRRPHPGRTGRLLHVLTDSAFAFESRTRTSVLWTTAPVDLRDPDDRDLFRSAGFRGPEAVRRNTRSMDCPLEVGPPRTVGADLTERPWLGGSSCGLGLAEST